MNLSEENILNNLRTVLVEEIGEDKVLEIEKELSKIKTRLNDVLDKVESDETDLDYVQNLSANILDYLVTLDDELTDNTDLELPESHKQMNKMMSRKARKKYYLSRWRL